MQLSDENVKKLNEAQPDLPAPGEVWEWGYIRCCERDFGGSHYHCGKCGDVTGMYGHYQPDSDLFSCEE